ncbi:MAG: carboxypeptidase regulatory-like domain-containing protein, partial [Bryobacterales bacterium]|nr:carboxypeptidase regulatory-like domain-containing protein [Bryobacterales bacterium]
MKPMLKRFGLVLAVLLCLVGAAYGQTANATISGKVTDSSGAIIPAATISAKNNDTNVVRTTQSNAEGLYTIPNLIPGNYTLTTQFQGMKNFERSG